MIEHIRINKQILVLVTFLISSPAYAYLDPGTVSLWLQGIIASVALGLTTINIFWHKVKTFYMRILRKPEVKKVAEFDDKENVDA